MSRPCRGPIWVSVFIATAAASSTLSSASTLYSTNFGTGTASGAIGSNFRPPATLGAGFVASPLPVWTSNASAGNFVFFQGVGGATDRAMSTQNTSNPIFSLGEFSLEAGYRATITTVSMTTRRSNSNINEFQFRVGGSIFGSVMTQTTADTFQLRTQTSAYSQSTPGAIPVSVNYSTASASIRVDDFVISGDTFLQSRGTASAGAASDSRVLVGQPATQGVFVGNNLVGLAAGTGANDVFAYSITGTDYTTTTGSTGSTINDANLSIVNVPIDTSSVGTKGGSLTVTPTATGNNYSVNNTPGNAPAVLSSGTVDVVSQRAVTASNTVNLGASIIGTPVSGASSFVTSGDDNVRTRVSLASGSISPSADGISAGGGSGGLFDDAADTATRTLSGAFSTVGLKVGSVDIPINGEGLAGEGAYADVAAGYTGLALDHSNGSFNGAVDTDSAAVAAGAIEVNQAYEGSLTVYNLKSGLDGSPNGDYTATMEVKGVAFQSGDNVGTLTIDSTPPIGATNSATFNFQFVPTVEGPFSSTFNLTVGDVQSILGWSNNVGGLSFTISGTALSVQAVPEPLTAASVLLLASRVLSRRVRVSL